MNDFELSDIRLCGFIDVKECLSSGTEFPKTPDLRDGDRS